MLPPKQGDFGEGFVEFQIDLARSTAHLDQLHADAVIVFDNNEPIETNQLEYTIDSIAPQLVVTRSLADNFILVEASDSGSGVRLVRIYDGSRLLFELNQTEFSVSLEPRQLPYEIYASVEDNVGNLSPARFYLQVFVQPESVTSCPNNCSGNGVCLQTIFACQCFDSYTEIDCSRNLTADELLNEPLDFLFGYKETDRRDEFKFELELQPGFVEAVVDIYGFPSEVQIITDLQLRATTNLTTTLDNETSRIEFDVKIPRGYDADFLLDLEISAEKIPIDEDEENTTTSGVVVTSSHKIPIRLKSFLPVSSVNLLDASSACFNGDENIRLKFEIEQLEGEDKVDISNTIISNTFVTVVGFDRIDDQLFEVTLHTDESDFEPVDIVFVFEIVYTQSLEESLIIKQSFVLDTCARDSSTTEDPSNTGVSTSKFSDETTSAENIYETTTGGNIYETTSGGDIYETTKKPGLSIPVLIGIIIGAIVGISTLLGLIVCIISKCKNNKVHG